MTPSAPPTGPLSPLPPRRLVRTVVAGLLTAVLLAALDATVMATALPTIVGGFGGLDQYAWVVSAYLLTSTVVMPLYGALSDRYGRRAVLRLAVALFLLGSLLCAGAQEMSQLIAFRGVQGLGAGGLLVLATTIISDLVPPRERARYQGLIGAVFGLASLAGPLLGGVLAEYQWRLIFLLNLPLGLLALLVTEQVLRRVPSPPRSARRINYFGALLLVGGVACLLLTATWGGSTYPWRSTEILGLASSGVLLLGCWALKERWSREPLLPVSLFRRATFAVGGMISCCFGAAMFGVITYVPIYLQVVQGHPPITAGLLLLPLMGGIVLASLVGGRLITRFGRYKWVTVTGAALMSGGTLATLTLRVESTPEHLAGVLTLVGVGIGLLLQPLIVTMQHGLARHQLGVATAAGTFLRQLGGVFGVAGLGAVLTGWLSQAVGEQVVGLLREPQRIAALPEPLLTEVRIAVVDSLHAAFAVATGFGLLCLLLTLLLPDRLIGPRRPEPAPPASTAAPATTAGS